MGVCNTWRMTTFMIYGPFDVLQCNIAEQNSHKSSYLCALWTLHILEKVFANLLLLHELNAAFLLCFQHEMDMGVYLSSYGEVSVMFWLNEQYWIYHS